MLSEIKGVGEKTLEKLNSLGIYDESDLLKQLPRAYIDLSVGTDLTAAPNGSFCLVDLLITEVKMPPKRAKIQFFRAKGEGNGYLVHLIWFYQNYFASKLATGKVYTFYGKVKVTEKGYELVNPQFEEKGEISKFQGIQPIYYTKGLLSQRVYWEIVKGVLAKSGQKSLLTPSQECAFGLLPYGDAICAVHIPDSLSVREAKNRIYLESIIRRIAAFRLEKGNEKWVRVRYEKCTDYDEVTALAGFLLSESQQKAIHSITAALQGKGLNAILCGDVGSGKTIVAILAAYFVAVNGYQTAFMAPTELLARQHYTGMERLLCPLGIRLGFLSSAVKGAERRAILDKTRAGEIDILVGTHALLSHEVEFYNLTFAVTDEQHRFGVAQRTGLINAGRRVDVLTLSATPIPRSLQLIAYGDITMIPIEKRHEGNVKTYLVTDKKREDMMCYLAEQCEKGGQIFVVAPKIEDTEGIESESVKELFKEFQMRMPKGRTAFLHGKMKGEEKDAVLLKFKENRIGVLVATTVIEVGIDVPNAGIMVVMDAERFGLATLHQLRGRVGRNGQPAACFLYTAKHECTERLKILTETNDGFLIAERDFEERGGGDVLGVWQSGAGSLHGMTLKNLKLAKKIVDSLDLSALQEELKGEIEAFSLGKVSLT